MFLLIAAALAAQAAPAAPASGEAADARCLIVLGFVGGRGNAAQQQASKFGVMYFSGKLRGRNPSIDLGKLFVSTSIKAQAEKLSVGPEAQRCGAELKAAGASLTAGVQAIAQKGAAEAAKRKP